MEGVRRISDGVRRMLDGVCRILEGVARLLAPHTHSLCRRARTAHARRNASDAVVAEEAGKTALECRPAGWGGGQGGVAGRVGWRAWSGGRPGRVAGRVGRRAGWGGWPGGQSRMDLQSKGCSGVNIVT